MTGWIPLLVVDVVLLVDALMRFGVADPLELGLGGDVFLQIAAGAPRLARGELGAVALDDVAVVVLACGFGTAVFHLALLSPRNGLKRAAVPLLRAGWNHRIRRPVEWAVQGNPTDILNAAQNAAAPATAAGSTATTVPGLHVFGVTLIGATAENGRKLLLMIVFVVAILIVGWLIRQLLKLFVGSRSGTRFHFWAKQAVSLLLGLILLFGIASIWFDNPARLATAIGLVGAGIAFALQRVVTAVAGYFVILRGKTFNVGDRIVMGGVRGDVVNLSFMQTQIMEMGQPPQVDANTDPAMWVHSRQFTGRIVTVTNDKVFDEPVYNYTHEFPYIWEEVRLPIRYADNRAEAERILVDSARRHALSSEKIGEDEVSRLQERFGIKVGDIDPKTYWRITDNWLEITVRFLAPDHGIRQIKDKMSRDILTALDEAKIGIASGTYAIVEVPPIKVEAAGA